ncbi:MAG: ABC transporter permease, partial [Fulvivirga sp.]|nr:ABC transporter permease [Fulvivirga sp.]
MLIKLAWRNIWRNKRRTYITAASIVFAVLLAILMNSVKEGVLIRLQENVVSFYTGAIQVHQNGYWEEQSLNNSFVESDSLISKILEHPEVNQVIGRIESFALAASQDYTKGCMVVGIEPNKESHVTGLNEKVTKGSYLTENDQSVLLAEGLASYLKLGVGDTIVIIGQGYHGISAAGKYPIKGLLHFASPDLNKSMIYLSKSHAQYLFGAPKRLTALVLDIDQVDHAENIQQELSAMLS